MAVKLYIKPEQERGKGKGTKQGEHKKKKKTEGAPNGGENKRLKTDLI